VSTCRRHARTQVRAHTCTRTHVHTHARTQAHTGLTLHCRVQTVHASGGSPNRGNVRAAGAICIGDATSLEGGGGVGSQKKEREREREREGGKSGELGGSNRVDWSFRVPVPTLTAPSGKLHRAARHRRLRWRRRRRRRRHHRRRCCRQASAIDFSAQPPRPEHAGARLSSRCSS